MTDPRSRGFDPSVSVHRLSQRYQQWSFLRFRLQGFKYLYLTPEDYKKVSAMNSVQCELMEEDGESRYRIKTIIGHKDGLGVENLQGSGMIAGETSQAYNEVVTFNLVSSTHFAFLFNARGKKIVFVVSVQGKFSFQTFCVLKAFGTSTESGAAVDM